MADEFRVFGPPGTGKSTWLAGNEALGIVGQVQRAAEKWGPERVMVTSFTRAAAVEIASRGTPLPDDNIGTLHSIGFRMAGRPDLADSPEGIKAFNQAHPRWRLSGAGEDAETPDQWRSTDADRLLMEYSRLRSELKEVPEYGMPALRAFSAAWEQWKSETGRMDFTDLLVWLWKHAPQPPRGIKVLFVDEAQDLTPLQFAIVRQWAPYLETLVVAGDDDQILYEHLGASPSAFLLPPVDDAHKRTLGQSHRVPEAVHAAAERWIRQVSMREPKLYRPRDEEGELTSLDCTSDFMADAVADAQARMDAGQSVMFLATCGYMLNDTKAQLKEAGVPFWNPYAQRRGDWNPLRAGQATGPAQRVAAFMGHEDTWWTWREFRDWTSVLASDGVLQRGAKAKLSRLPDDGIDFPMAQEDWTDLVEPEAVPFIATADLDWYGRHLLASKKDSHAYALRIAQQRGKDALTARPRCIIGTIHSVKGGESHAVYLMPDLSVQGVRAWTTRAGRDAIIRQMYVGMTRASQSLVLLRAPNANAVTGMG